MFTSGVVLLWKYFRKDERSWAKKKHRALGGNFISLNCSMYIPWFVFFFFTCKLYSIASRFPEDSLLMLSMRFHNIPVFIVDQNEFPDAWNKILQSFHEYCVHELFTVTRLLSIHNMCMILTLVLPSITVIYLNCYNTHLSWNVVT